MAAPSPDGPDATVRSCSTGLDASSSIASAGRCGQPQIPGPGSRARPPHGTSTRSLRLGSSGVRGEEMLQLFGGGRHGPARSGDATRTQTLLSLA